MDSRYSAGKQIPFISELATHVRDRWKQADHSEASLPEVALRAFEAVPVPDELNASGILAWGLTTECLPPQTNSVDFGNPPICLHYDERFYMDAYIWRESTTTIHDHGFSGAFCVLQGESLQTQFHFEADDSPMAALEFGHLKVTGCEVLTRGETRPIHSGTKLIHSVFHLMHPSVTLCIRSFQDHGVVAQREYHLPHTTHFSQKLKNKRSPHAKRLAMIECGFDLDDKRVKRIVSDLVRSGDWLETFQIVSKVAMKYGMHAAQPLLEVIGHRHAERGKRIEVTLRETCRRNEVLSLRQLVRDEDQRFLLALLANLPDRESILDQMRLRYPGIEPADQIGNLYAGIATSIARQVPGPIAKIHSLNALAVPHLLRGLPQNLVSAKVMDEIDQNNMKAGQDAVDASIRSLPDANLLKPLFTEPLKAAA